MSSCVFLNEQVILYISVLLFKLYTGIKHWKKLIEPVKIGVNLIVPLFSVALVISPA